MYINPEVFDQGLDYADVNGTRIDLCSQEPTTYAEATTDGAFSLGNKTGLNTGAPEAGATDGRRVIVPAITNGTVTETGTATHWALTDNSAVLIAACLLSSPQAVTDSNPITLDAISITIRGPA